MRSLKEAGIRVLRTADADEKARLTHAVAAAWRDGSLECITATDDPEMPASPERPGHLTEVPPNKLKTGGRKRFIHSLVHAESCAVDLTWDIIVRFCDDEPEMPREFYDDWVRVADEEAKHYSKWDKRLQELGGHYGCTAVHEGLWEAASRTAHSLKDRLAVVHMIHEGRGLDVYPIARRRFEKAGDDASKDILDANFNEEITRVGAAVKWFSFLCAAAGEDPSAEFATAVHSYHKGLLKPPFNKSARDAAGFPQEW